MGDAADDLYFSQDIWAEIMLDKEEALMEKLGAGIWTTRDQEEIPLATMTDSHLENALRFFGRAEKSDLNDLRLEVLLKEQERRHGASGRTEQRHG